MLLFLHNHRVSMDTAMRMAGYHKRNGQGDYIREDHGLGRYHAKRLGFKVLDLHYDIYLASGFHYAPHLPLKMREEQRRIRKRLYPVKIRDMGADELRKLLEKHLPFSTDRL